MPGTAHGHHTRPIHQPPVRPNWSSGNGGIASGRTARDIKTTSLSSPAMRLDRNVEQLRQRWMMAHSPPRRIHTAIGSISPRQPHRRSPGWMSRCTLQRQWGQWLRCRVPPASGTTVRLQWSQMNAAGASGIGFFCFTGISPSGCCGESVRLTDFGWEDDGPHKRPFQARSPRGGDGFGVGLYARSRWWRRRESACDESREGATSRFRRGWPIGQGACGQKPMRTPTGSTKCSSMSQGP